MSDSARYVRLLDKRGRVGRMLHIVKLQPSARWKGETWCGILGEGVAAATLPQAPGRVCPRCRRARHD